MMYSGKCIQYCTTVYMHVFKFMCVCVNWYVLIHDVACLYIYMCTFTCV